MLELVPGGHRPSGEAVGDRTHPIIHPPSSDLLGEEKGGGHRSPELFDGALTAGHRRKQWSPVETAEAWGHDAHKFMSRLLHPGQITCI